MTHAEIIDSWPSLGEFAADLQIKYGTAKAMRRRSSIPEGHWLAVVRCGTARGLSGVTLETLAKAVEITPDEVRA